MVNRNIYIVDSTINNMDTQTYGKQNMIKGLYNSLKYRFIVSRHTQNLLHTSSLTHYVPKVNKVRLSVAIVASIIFIIVPLLGLLSIPTMVWGIK